MNMPDFCPSKLVKSSSEQAPSKAMPRREKRGMIYLFISFLLVYLFSFSLEGMGSTYLDALGLTLDHESLVAPLNSFPMEE